MFDRNKDALTISPDDASVGPRVGFLDSFEVSYQAQRRGASQFGIERYMHDLDWAQTKAMLDAGVASPPQLYLGLEDGAAQEDPYRIGDDGYYESFAVLRSSEYLDVARRYSGEEVGPEFDAKLQAYDARINAIRQERPDLKLKSSREMFDDVRANAQRYDAREQQDRRTWGGTAGMFAGGVIGSMSPDTDPLNFATLAVGGAGRTAATRILSQTAGQGVIEGVNQVTGVQEERQLLGLSYGLSDAAMRIGTTAVGAGVLQGAAEGLAYAGRRFFRDTPNDPAPALPAPPEASPDPAAAPRADAAPVEDTLSLRPRTYLDELADRNPLSGLRFGKSRAVADISDATRQLDDWSGVNPSAIRPRSATDDLDFEGIAARGMADTAARASDPKLFDIVDKLQARAADMRRRIETASVPNPEDDFAGFARALGDRPVADMARLYQEASVDRMRPDVDFADWARRNGDVPIAEMESRFLAERTKIDPEEDFAGWAKQNGDELISEGYIATQLGSMAAQEQRVTPMQRLEAINAKLKDLSPEVARAYARARGDWEVRAEDVDAVRQAYDEGRTPELPPRNNLPSYDEAVAMFDRIPILRRQNILDGQSRSANDTVADVAIKISAEDAKIVEQTMEQFDAASRQLLSETSDGKLVIEGKTYEFDINRDKIFVETADGQGGREVTIRELLDENKRANEELEAVSSCSIGKVS